MGGDFLAWFLESGAGAGAAASGAHRRACAGFGGAGAEGRLAEAGGRGGDVKVGV